MRLLCRAIAIPRNVVFREARCPPPAVSSRVVRHRPDIADRLKPCTLRRLSSKHLGNEASIRIARGPAGVWLLRRLFAAALQVVYAYALKEYVVADRVVGIE